MLRDYLNYPLRDELRTYILAPGQAVAVLGVETVGDIPQETWYFDENSYAEDNGETVIKPDEILDTEPGRFHINMVQGDYANLFNKPDFADVALSGDYNDLANKLSAGEGISIDSGVISTAQPTVNTVSSRPIDSDFTVSSTKAVKLNYTLAFTTSLSSATLNSSAKAYLEYSTDSGSTWITADCTGISRGISSIVAATFSETTYQNLSAQVPANASVRIRTTTTGSSSVAWESGVELTY